MKAANEHFAKRFMHLKEIEFIAQTKHVKKNAVLDLQTNKIRMNLFII